MIFLLSGAAGLGYQMVFVRMFAVGLGHEMASVLAVVGAFFGGLALGAWVLRAPLERSHNPGLWYAGLEVVIAVWGLGCVWSIGLASTVALRWTGTDPSATWQWAVAFGVPLVALLPATMAMGATLPAMERCASPLAPGGRCIAGLYAVNTAGAVAGTLLGTFFVVPALGYRATLMMLAGVNLVCAVMMVPFIRRAETPLDRPRAAASAPEDGPRSHRRLLVLLFATGLLGISYEVVALRVIAHVIENTVYSYAAALSVYLVGTALGAGMWQVFGARWASSRRTTGVLLASLATACLLGTAALASCREVYLWSRVALGDSTLAVLVSEVTVASLVFFLPTLLMGATFSHLTQAAKRGEGGVGSAVAVNTAGGFVAPLLAGVVLIPAVGTRWSLILVSLAYLVPIVAERRRPRWLMLAPFVALLLVPADLGLIQTHEGDRVISQEEGVMASVAVVDGADGHRNLRVNNRLQMGGTGPTSTRMELRQGHVPLLLHPAPRRALFLGVGSGITAMAAAHHEGLRSDAVELVPEVVQALPAFTIDGRSLLDLPAVRVHTADARRFVRASTERYDVIIADLFHPARDGAGMLYTREHFEAIRRLLAPGGLFCQWLPMYQMDDDTIRTVVATFLEVFPEARAVMNDVDLKYPAIGLIGPKTIWPDYGADWLDSRVADASLRQRLATIGIKSDDHLFGLLVTGPEGLREFADSRPVNTDDRPIVVYRAPAFAVQRGRTTYGRMLAMLREVAPERSPWSMQDAAAGARVREWIAGRNQAIERAVERAGANRRDARRRADPQRAASSTAASG